MSKKPIKRKLWYKKKEVLLDPVVEEYNSGEDIHYDQLMVLNDVDGSWGYGKMLNRHGILTDEELAELKKGLDEIRNLYKKVNLF